MAASRKVFARRPFSAVRLKADILDPAGVSVGSFYHQFRDKTELLIALLEEHSEILREELGKLHDPGSGRPPEAIARDAYGFVFDIVDEEPDLMRIRLREDLEGDLRIAEFLRRDAAAWNESRARYYERLFEAYGVDLDVHRAAEMIGVLTDGAIRHYLRIPRKERPAARERLLDGVVQLTLGGLPAFASRR